MKKIFAMSFFFGLCAAGLGGDANAAAQVPWWHQPTICRPNPTNCYAAMGAGFDNGMWDAASNCWGMKMVCGDALAATGSDKYMGKTEIAAGTGINPDFDMDLLNGGCFGIRKTAANGSMASVGGKFVNVWCSGVLDNPSETLPTGEITSGAQPNCKDLAKNGWIGILNQKCYGKYYNPDNYYIECAGNAALPARLIVLNGANAVTGTVPGNYPYPTDVSKANDLFDKMQSVSASQKSQYFK
jgi:hypothetical protein